MPASLLKRLPPEMRRTILDRLSACEPNRPVSIAEMVHALSEQFRELDMSETTLKSCIAEAAIRDGRAVAFDGT